MNIKQLGQVFTSNNEVDILLSLKKNNGNVLEPSCGSGNISNRLSNVIAIEYDKSIKNHKAIYMDFFEYPISNKFDTIIGNPPYVAYKDILPNTKYYLDLTIFDKRTNLYMFFIYKCIQHLNDGGELIFITPRSFLQATCCIKLNNYIFNTGTITNVIDLGDKKLFDTASPNVLIWRFVKGNKTKRTLYNNVKKTFYCNKGQLLFLQKEYNISFSDLFYVKVGGVSGNDLIFNHSSGNIDVVCSYTNKTNQTKRMIYNNINEHLLNHKDILISRKIKRFNELNWYKWGRDFYISKSPRIYVNNKTRNNNPFFIYNSIYYDGSIMGVFPYNISIDIKVYCKMLNSVDWNELGFMCNNRYIFNQKSLLNTLLPNTFKGINENNN